MTAGSLRVLGWNTNLWTSGRSDEKAQLLEELDWDVALLQELTPRALAAIRSGVTTSGIACGLELVDLTGKRPYTSAVLCRDPLTLTAGYSVSHSLSSSVRHSPTGLRRGTGRQALRRIGRCGKVR